METVDAYTLLLKGKRFLEEGHPHQAAVVLERATVAEPRKASIREALARALYNSGQTARAQEEFSIAVELDPSNDYAYFGLGMCYAKTGDVSAARGQLKIAVAMRPDITYYREALNKLPA